MAAYDSDSSEDGSIHPTTNVMLGYVSAEPTDDPFSQLGGSRTWPDASSPPSASLARCKTCNTLMSLLLQLNGDLPERFAGHERKLYVFACRNKACRRKSGTVRAIRGVKHNQAQKQKQGKAGINTTSPQAAAPKLGDSIFASNGGTPSNQAPVNPFVQKSLSQNQNPFSPQAATSTSPFATSNTPPAATTTSSLSATFAQKAQISNPPASSTPASNPPQREPWPTTSPPQAYPSYHLDADYETLSPTSSSSDASASASTSNQRMDIDAEDSNTTSTLDKDTFESSLDKPFQIFSDRLAQNPEQVLRYEFGGQPLLYSRSDAVASRFASTQPKGASNVKVKTQPQGGAGMPKCENCGKGRVFECQLVPHAITELEVDEMGLDGMEWGTVIMGVCEADCAEKGVEAGQWGWLEEWVGVQWEEVGRMK